MVRLKTATELEIERLETLQRLTGNYPIEKYTRRPALVYSRYSTAKQVRESIAQGLEQSKKLLQRADDLGWTQELLTLLIENQMTKDGRIRSVSGTIPIEDRAGMQVVIDGVKNRNAGAIICDDVSRLTRDADLVDAMTLAKVCKQHDTIIVTSDRVYNFKRQSDFDAYVEEARAAANWLETHQKGKMLRNRTRKAEQGKLANGVAPVGLMAVGDRRSELVPSPHAARVDWLYARFRAHGASIGGLLGELMDMARRGEPVFPVHPDIDPKQMFLARVERDGELLGWTPTSKHGLKHILTNPAYIGHLVFNGRIVKRNAHQAIVDAVNWRYAFDALATVDLDGTPIQHEQKTIRYKQKASQDKGALLTGTRYNGRAIIDGLDGSHVYYKSHTERYILRKISGIGKYEAAISSKDLDRLFEEHMLDWLATSEAVARFVAGFPDAASVFGLPQVHEVAYGVNGTEQSDKPDDTIAEIDGQIAETERNINIGGKYMTDKELEDSWAKLARLRKRKEDIEQTQANHARMVEELRKAAGDVCIACQQWHSWKIDRKRRLIRLVTEAITLERVSDGWLRLTVKWTPVLGGLVESCYIWQTAGMKWQSSEIAILHEMYATATRKELLQLLPARTWRAITNQACALGLHRAVMDGSTNNQVIISESDLAVIKRFRLSRKRVQWVVSQVSNGDKAS